MVDQTQVARQTRVSAAGEEGMFKKVDVPSFEEGPGRSKPLSGNKFVWTSPAASIS